MVLGRVMVMVVVISISEFIAITVADIAKVTV